MIDLFCIACEVLGIDKNTVNAELSFISAKEIQELNQNYRSVDKPTDVLSFPMIEIEPGKIPLFISYPLDINPKTNKIELGDVVVCREFAKLPIDLLCVHGFLHLLGYDHDTPMREKEMFEITEVILEAWKKNAGY